MAKQDTPVRELLVRQSYDERDSLHSRSCELIGLDRGTSNEGKGLREDCVSIEIYHFVM